MNMNIDIDDVKRQAYFLGQKISNAGKQSNRLPVDDSAWPIIQKMYKLLIKDDGVDIQDKYIVMEAVANKWSAIFLSSLDNEATQETKKNIAKRQNHFKENWSWVLEDDFSEELNKLISFKSAEPQSKHKM